MDFQGSENLKENSLKVLKIKEFKKIQQKLFLYFFCAKKTKELNPKLKDVKYQNCCMKNFKQKKMKRNLST